MEEICFETKAIEGRYVAAKLLNSDQSKVSPCKCQTILGFHMKAEYDL